MPSSAYDVLLTPCGIYHSVGGSRKLSDGPSYGCGFASPPQLDLDIDSPFFQSGTFTAPLWTVLSKASQE